MALAAAVLLAVSQFLDYREVRAGVPAYAGVEAVAPAAAGRRARAETAGSAHAYVLRRWPRSRRVLVVLAMLGRWRLARLLLFRRAGRAVAIAVLIDAPDGLDEGATAIAVRGRRGAPARRLLGSARRRRA